MRKSFILTLIVSTFMLWACDGKDSTVTDNVDIENENETADVNASVDSGEESSQESMIFGVKNKVCICSITAENAVL